MANKGDIYKVALPNGDEYNFKDKYVRENYRALNNNDFDTINVTELNSGNIINTGAARFLNTINGSISGNAVTATLAADSSKLNGYASDTSATNNTIVRRTANGYIFGTYFNQSSGAETPTSSSYIIYANSDGYFRKSSLANIKTILGLGEAAYKAVDTTVTSGSSNLITSGAVAQAIDNLPEPMVFKGTLGTNGTITALPTASASNEGYTYKVITAGTYASQAAKVGDVFVCAELTSGSYSWVLIPAGDTDSDSWRNIKVNGTEKLTTAISSGAVDFVNGTNTTVSFNSTGNKIQIDAVDTKYALDISGNNVILKKDGVTQDTITVPYATSAGSATKATQDESGNNIKATYAASFSISDHTITLKNKNGASLGTVTVPDNNTNYYHKTGSWNGLTYTAAKVGSPEDLTFTIPTGTTSTTVARGDHTHNYKDIIPLVSKTYASTSYYATSAGDWNTSTWYFMSVKPDSWYKPWKVKFKIRSFCPSYTNVDSITWATISGREQSCIFSNWNERYDTGHYYTAIYPLKKAGFDAGYGHAIGISILYGTNYTNSAYYRTFELDYYECENCTVTILDTPVKWTDWTGTGTTNYGGLSGMDAVNRGLRETGDDNDTGYYIRRIYPNMLVGPNKVFPYTMIMQNSDGRWESIVTSSSAGTSKAVNTHGFRLSNVLLMYASSTYNENNSLPTYNVWSMHSGLIDHRYSFNTANNSTNGTTGYKPIYLVGTINATDGLFYLDSTKWWTQTLPTSADGKLYIYIGDAYDYYRMTFVDTQKIYWYINGKVQEYAQSSNYATTAPWSGITGKPSTYPPSSHDHSQIVTVGDKRSTSTTPNDYGNKIIFQGLKNKATIGSPSTDTYSYLIGLRGWSDSSGGDSHELAFNNTGIFRRQGATDTWGTWKALLDSDNYTSYTVKKDGTGASGTWGISISGNAATATTATKLGTSTVGGATTPIYLNAGVPTALSYTIAKSVPSDAVFTDQNVYQSSTNTANWRKVALGVQNDATAGTAVTNQTGQVYVTPNVEVQSSTGTIRTTGNLQVSGIVCANVANSSTAGGLSLYSTNPQTYGVIFRGTGNQGKHGYVQGDWATYFTMDGADTRGWVFRNAASGKGNVASISSAGHAVFNGSVTIGGNETNTSGVRQVYNATTQSLDFVFVA